MLKLRQNGNYITGTESHKEHLYDNQISIFAFCI